jgi:hypothetical protein
VKNGKWDHIEDGEADETGEEGHDGNAPTHGFGCDPSLGTGSFGAKAVGTVGAFAEVEVVVDEVGINLHEDSEEEAEDEETVES